MILRLAILALLALPACNGPDPVFPQQKPDCAGACTHLTDTLKCPAFDDTCEEVCLNAEKNGLDWQTGCIVESEDCGAADLCWKE